MFTEELLNKLKAQQAGKPVDRDTFRAMRKMKTQQRLSSKEFLKVYDSLWQEGPKIKYQTPDEWLRHLHP